MLRTLFIFAVVACVARTSNCYYTIVGPAYIESNSPYSVYVSSKNDFAMPISLTIQNDQGFSTSQSTTVQPQSSGIVSFAFGTLSAGEYKLIATGKNLNETETSLTLQTKTMSVFIQSDKAMYKPGDKVQFRVIVVDKNLNPATIKNMDIYITDGNQNRVEQWLGASTSMGVYVGELQLGTSPCLGNWKINVNVDNESSAKDFEVAEYVLPKFEVIVTPPKAPTYSDGTLTISAKATYTYGQPVKGVAQFAVSRNNYWDPSPQPVIAQKQVNIDGTGTATFQIVSDLKLSADNWQDDLKITVAVTEELTGVVLEGSTTTSIRRSKFTVTNLANDYTYQPGAFTLSLQFSYYDGSPYLDDINTIQVSYGTNWDKTGAISLGTGKIGANGVAKIALNLPDSEGGFYIFIKFLDYYDSVGYYQKPQPSQQTTDDGSLTVTLLSTGVKIGDTISVEVSSGSDLSSIDYLLSARGDLILSQTQQVSKQKSVVITFQATFAMVPTAQFVAYYISSSGDIVAGRTEISVSGLNNFVTITTSASEKKPGESVGITISTKPSSLACIVAIDQSVALLKAGNDILQSYVYDELGLYNTVSYNDGPVFGGGPIFGGPVLMAAEAAPMEEAQAARKKRSIWWPGGGGGSRQNFNAAGLFVITDCNPDPPIFYPMFAMNMAMAGGAAPVAEMAVADGSASVSPATSEVRKYFPETWIWDCFDSGSGSITRNEKVPDTITSWYLTGFATNNQYGLGVTEDKTIFKVFKNFFISLNLPYSVKRGEAFLLQIVIFNYLPKKVTATVTLDNSLKQYEFVDPDSEAYRKKGCPKPIEASRSTKVTVNSNDGTPVSFLISALRVGSIIIKVSAKSSVAGDSIEIPLIVEAEGATQYKNKALFVDLRSAKKFSADVTVDVPKNAVPDSTRVQVSANGDVLGTALQNIDSLLQMPCGCGEQTMIGLAPDVVIYIYLKKVGLLTPALDQKLLGYMNQGIQNELSYAHSDHSFSAFGNSDPSGSSWLTAFVVRVFIQAKPFATVDENVIKNALDWLVGQQDTTGRFNEPGNVIHTDMQGEAAKGVGLTAYIIVSFVVDPTYAAQYAAVIEKGLDYVYNTLQTQDDVYSLAIATYAAYLANYKNKEALLQKLDSYAKVQGDRKWWEKVQLDTPTDPWSRPPSVNVEISGYALSAYVAAGKTTEGLPIAKWIISQQSASGGFTSTQDTVVGIAALATFAGEISSANAAVTCKFTYTGQSSTLTIDKTNSLVLQSLDLPPTTKTVNVDCTGMGFALVQVSYEFNLNDAEQSPRFTLTVNVDKKSNDNSLILNICTKYIADSNGDTTNMAIIEAELPTGFTADLATTKTGLASVKGFKKVETKKGNTVIVVYLDNLSSTSELCLQVVAYRLCQVAGQKPVAVTVQDYYRTERKKTTFYSLTPKTVCSLCDTDACKASCSKPKQITCPKKPVQEICKNPSKILAAVKEWLKKILASFC